MSRSQRLAVALGLNGALIVGQVGFGLGAHSLGLLADAAHNLTDAFALGLALVGVRLSYRLPTPKRSYGWHRATILAALANAVSILVVATVITVEAVRRLSQPEVVRGGTVLVVALIATLLNLGAALVLREPRERSTDLNMRSALLHMAGDAAASLGVAAAGAVILITGRLEWLDPAVSIAISVVIAIEAWQLMRSAVDVLLEAAPSDLDLDELQAAMAEIDGVAEVHDLHVWSLSSGIRVLSAHVAVADASSLAEAEVVGRLVRDAVGERFAIAHATLELESAGSECVADVERHIPG
jgi:cobalt-zinc-cadmium efflux system protein